MATTAFTSRYRQRSSEGGFESLGGFLRAVLEDGLRVAHDPRLDLVATAGSDEHSSVSQQYGGFAVPVELVERLFRVDQSGAGRIIGMCTQIPVSSGFAQVPARVDKNHSSSVAGGIVITRKPETVAATPSRGELEQIGFEVTTASGLVYASEQLLEDSPRLMEEFLTRSFEDALRALLLGEILFGTGTGQPLGVLNSPCLISVPTTAQTTGTLTAANILGMAKRCWRYAEAGVWLANYDTYAILAAVDIGSRPALVWESGAPYLHGRPIIFTEHAAALNTAGDIVLGVWSEYLIATRSERLEESIHVRFAENERAIKISVRNDGEPWWRSPLTPKNGANTLSPFVALDTRTT